MGTHCYVIHVLDHQMRTLMHVCTYVRMHVLRSICMHNTMVLSHMVQKQGKVSPTMLSLLLWLRSDRRC